METEREDDVIGSRPGPSGLPGAMAEITIRGYIPGKGNALSGAKGMEELQLLCEVDGETGDAFLFITQVPYTSTSRWLNLTKEVS